MALKTYTKENKYKIARGDVMISIRRADGTYEGFRLFGNCPAFTLSVETENYQHTNSQAGIGVVDLDVPISVTRSSNITVDNLDNDNIGLFLGSTPITFNQSSGSVAAEAVLAIAPERAYQLGLDQNIAGVRNVTSVVPTVNATARANSTAYTKGQIYKPAVANDHIYACTVAGTSAASPPTFTTDGTTFADGTATFIDLGAISALAADTDYIVDGPNGLLSIPVGGKLASACNAGVTAGLVDADTGAPLFSINLAVAYTRPANKRQEIKAGATASLRCKIMFKANNAYGENQDVLIPDCTLAPSGELAMIGENEASSVEFALGINILDSTTPPVMIIGESKAA